MDPLQTAQPLHEESKNFLMVLEKMGAKGYDQTGSVDEARRLSLMGSKISNGAFDFKGQRNEIFVPSPEVKDGIPVYVYVPNNLGENPPIHIYLH